MTEPHPPQAEEEVLPETWGQMRPKFKNRIIAGLIFIVPLGVTGIVGWWIYSKVLVLTNQWIKGIVEDPTLPGWSTPLIYAAGVIVTVFAIVALLWLVGTLSSTFLIRRVMRLFEGVLLGLPVVRTVYSFSKQIVSLVSDNRGEKVQRVVLVEYPKAGSYALAFATGETVLSDTEEPHITVFLPTTPNPTSGFMLVIPRAQVREANMAVEEAVRVIISGGIIIPPKLQVGPLRSGRVGYDPPPELLPEGG